MKNGRPQCYDIPNFWPLIVQQAQEGHQSPKPALPLLARLKAWLRGS